MALLEYRSKRDFSKTPEPGGMEESGEQAPLRFVVHKHHASRLHWDLRLELEGVLKSWAIPKGPSLDPGNKRLAVMVEDHPIDYQYFEGVIPKGNYGAGPVMIWDRGTYRAINLTDRRSSEEALKKGLEKGHITFILDGQKLKGEFALVRLRKGEGNNWLLVKKADEYATGDPAPGAEKSAVSGLTMEEIEADPSVLDAVDLSDAPAGVLPHRMRPMLATLVSGPFDRPGWIYEIKWDGYRCIAEITTGAVRLYSRNGKTLNNLFPSLVEALESVHHEAVLDGEIVVVDRKGKADFQMLQAYLSSQTGNLVYYVFDIPYLDGHDLKSLPLLRRKEILRKTLPGSPVVRFSDYIETEGLPFFQVAGENNLEGIVAKDGQSPYRPGHRGREWLKIKTYQRQEAVVGGFTEPRGGRQGFGSLVLGVYENGSLDYVGHTGSGFSDKALDSLRTRLQQLSTEKPAFRQPPKTPTPVTWVEPRVVCEVRFAEWTRDGLMRHPVFVGLREDVEPTDVHRERPVDDR
jgi:bifunctional non-homologous end joining protein LigD